MGHKGDDSQNLHMITCIIFLILNRLLFISLPLHCDIGFFGNWAHFKTERLDHDLIFHNGGFRSAALFLYGLFLKTLGPLGVKGFSRIGQLLCLLASFYGYALLFEELGWDPATRFGFYFFYAILVSSFTTGVVYIFTIELLGICCLPFLLSLFFLAGVPFVMKLALAVAVSLLFKPNLCIDVLFFYGFFHFSNQGLEFYTAMQWVLGAGAGLAIHCLNLALLGVLKFSVRGFLAFSKFRNQGWYAWKRLFLAFLNPILLENCLPLLALGLGGWSLIQEGDPLALWVLWFFLIEVFGILIQRGFFHYHYISLIPGVALVASQAKLFSNDPLWVPLVVLVGYSVLRFCFSGRQFWPKALEHQEIYNRLVDELGDSAFIETIRNSRITWFAGWRFQFHLLYDAKPFSVFLHTVKFMMLLDAEDERRFMPEFKQEFFERLRDFPPDLLIMEETELLELKVMEQFGFKVEYLGTYRGRLKFFRLSPPEILDYDLFSEHYQALFLRYPGQFSLDFFQRLAPQYLKQAQGEKITLVGSSPSQKEVETVFREAGFSTQKMSCLDFERGAKNAGVFFLVEEGRSVDLYWKVHRLISDKMRIFKFT
jgi:hypothetical protein